MARFFLVLNIFLFSSLLLYFNLSRLFPHLLGSSSGIGAGTAELFAKEGANVTITGRNEDRLKATRDAMIEAGAKDENILIVVGDVVEQKTREDIINKTIEKWGKLNILINNAGAGFVDEKGKVGLMMDTDLLHKTMNLNLTSVLELIKLARPHLVASKGEIINVSSIAGLNFGFKSSPFYAISKAALDQMTRAVALELIEEDVRVNSVNPGYVFTNFFQNVGFSESASDTAYAYWEKHRDIIPRGKVGTPTDIASVIAFLADRNLSGYIVGQTIVADGGSSIVMAASAHDLAKVLSQ